MKKNIIAIIPARGKSKGIPKKNITPFAGKPLIAYTIETAFQSELLDRVIVSTDDAEIASVATQYGAEVLMRPAALAQDDTPDLPVFQHALQTLRETEGYTADIVVNLRPTCPLRNVHDINLAITKMLETDCDSVRTVTRAKDHPYWMMKFKGDQLLPFLDDIDIQKYYRRQLLPDAYILNGGVDVMKAAIIETHTNLYGTHIKGVLMPAERSVDIDTVVDVKIAEALLKGGI